MIDVGRQRVRRVYAALGAAYVRVLMLGGSAAVAFFAVWPMSTVVIVATVAASVSVLSKVRALRSGSTARRTSVTETATGTP